jgi:hypothetical protein
MMRLPKPQKQLLKMVNYSPPVSLLCYASIPTYPVDDNELKKLHTTINFDRLYN